LNLCKKAILLPMRLLPQKRSNEYIVLGHFIKYNIYLLSKSLIFMSIAKSSGRSVSSKEDIDFIVDLTHDAMHKLDSAAKSN